MKTLSKQQQDVFNILKQRGETTARKIIRITNYPSCLIRDLRKKGIKIDTVSIKGKNYDKYVLVER